MTTAAKLAADVIPIERQPTLRCHAARWDVGSRFSVATMAAVVGGGVVRVVASGVDRPRSRRSAIIEALAGLPAGPAAWLLGVEHRLNGRRPVVRVVRQLRRGEGTPEDAVPTILSAFHGPPAPPPEPKPAQPPRPCAKAPACLLDAWLTVPPYLRLMKQRTARRRGTRAPA